MSYANIEAYPSNIIIYSSISFHIIYGKFQIHGYKDTLFGKINKIKKEIFAQKK